MYAGHGTPETEKVAFNEKPIVNSIWTVVKDMQLSEAVRTLIEVSTIHRAMGAPFKT